MKSHLCQHWIGRSWVNEWLYTFTYDANNNMTSQLRQYWNGGTWMDEWQITFTYDANNNMTSQLRQSWNGGTWMDESQLTFTYDANNNMTSQLYQSWDGTQWVNNFLITFTYDTDGNQLSELTQYWEGTQWMNAFLETYTYDTNGNRLSWLFQGWNDSTWVDAVLHTYTYDTNDNQLSTLRQQWENNIWVNSTLFTFTYDTDGNQLSELYQNWDGNDWTNSTQWINTYTTSSPIFVEVDDKIINEDYSLTIELEVGSPLVPTGYSFFVFSDTNDVNVINDSNLVTINPMENWYGNTEITAIVVDGDSLSDTTSFLLTVNPVNDPPEPFSVLYPTVTDTFSSHIDSNTDIGFTWGGCNDVDNDITYKLNLIDTPGHVDFTYEVSRSMAACEGALLLIDCTQGVEAQTVSNTYMALESNLEIIPILNKVDMKNADIENSMLQIKELLGCEEDEIIQISAKTGEGVNNLFDVIINRIDPPIQSKKDTFKALIFDSYYDQYRGVIIYIKIVIFIFLI